MTYKLAEWVFLNEGIDNSKICFLRNVITERVGRAKEIRKIAKELSFYKVEMPNLRDIEQKLLAIVDKDEGSRMVCWQRGEV